MICCEKDVFASRAKNPRSINLRIRRFCIRILPRLVSRKFGLLFFAKVGIVWDLGGYGFVRWVTMIEPDTRN